MQLHFTGRNIEITEAIKNYIQKKFQRIEHRDEKITQAHVTLQVEHLDHIAEATLHLHGIEMHATAKSNDMYAAIDELVDKLLGQVTKHKEKISDHR